jgi:predicted nucleotidyltransferase
MDRITEGINRISKKYKIEKVLLFGSRARGDHSYVSDYDIAVFGNNLSEIEKARFCDDIEGLETLKKVDIVFVSQGIDDNLAKNIMKDGVLIYEQVRSKT